MQSKLIPLLRHEAQTTPEDLFSEDVVFHSPVKDYDGRADVTHILTSISKVMDTVERRDELVAGRKVVTLISAVYGDHRMTGVLEETHDGLGRVESATLLLRPLSALREAIAAMRGALERSPLPSTLAARG
jgi:hypothetical protein